MTERASDEQHSEDRAAASAAEQVAAGGAHDEARAADAAPSPAAQSEPSAPRPEITVAGLADFLTDWVARTTGMPRAEIDQDRPLEEFGLSSRDAVALSGEIEDLTGAVLDATIVYQHPTISTLAERIVLGPPEVTADAVDDTFYLRPAGPGAHDIAIVGLAQRLPGAGETPEQLWQMLDEGRDGITDRPEGRWGEYASDPVIAAAIAEANTRGGYIEDVELFDAEFFGMSPREAEMVDPQQRLALELTWEALEHARIPASDLKGRSVGVFLGSSANDYQLLAVADPATAHPYAITGNSTAIIANRVSYFFDFRGPSVALDTACSSSLVAVHQAVRALRGGEADVAVAGGVNMLVAPAASLGFDQLGVMAPDGRIKAFSADADGMIRSEGGGVLVLKRLADAERDGDDVLAVVSGSAVNQDGRSNGLTAPNPDAQVDVLRRAYRDAGILPSTVDYIEAHGTGTVLGDPIEAGALAQVVGRGRETEAPALLGSAKTNFGHLEAAAGAAGLIKVVLAMRHDRLPASLNYTGPNPMIDFDAARLKVIDSGAEWPRYSGRAVAGVSGFGFGGTNAHVVVREYAEIVEADPASGDTAPADGAAETAAAETELTVEVEQTEDAAVYTEATGPTVLVVSAAMPSRRRRAAEDLANWLETAEGSVADLQALGRTLARRNHGRSRAAVLAYDRAEAIAGLRALAAGKPAPNVLSADSPAAKGPVWVFSGYGSQHRKMGKELYLTNAVFRAEVDRVDELVEFESGHSMREMFLDDAQNYDVETSQVGIFTIQVGLAAVLRHHGADPVAVVGHSMGEAAASYVSGGLSLEDAVRVICVRSRLMGEGEATLVGDDIRRMALVEYSAEAIEDVLTEFPDLEVCVYAAPHQTVIGGPEPQVEAIVARAESEGKFSRILQAKGASHTSQVDPILGELAAELAGIDTFPPTSGVYSSVHEGDFFPAGSAPIHGEDYWTKGMRHSVYFDQAVKKALAAGHTTFVELAPNPATLMSIAMTCYDQGVLDPQLIWTLKRKEDDALNLRTALATLYVHGHRVDLDTLFAPGPYVDVPRTGFQRKHLWIDTRIATGGGVRMPGAHVALPDGTHAWEVIADAVTDPALLITAAAAEVLDDAQLTALETVGEVPTVGTVTTTVTPHPGGAAVRVDARTADGVFRPLARAVLSAAGERTERAVAAAAAVAREAAADPGDVTEVDYDAGSAASRWDPDGDVPLEHRLREIVAESMGFATEDLPTEVPLMELGLDSLMAVRIKNRVEYEFDIPQLQLQAVRDANLDQVAEYLRYAVDNREEVAALAEQQAREAAEAAAAGEQAVGGTYAAQEMAEELPETAQAETDPVPAAGDAAPAATPTADSAAGAPETVDGQAADVPPRDAAERLTFGLWAVVTGSSARGVFNRLPEIDTAQVEALASRLSERAGGEITVEQVRGAASIEQLSDLVRAHLEADVGLVRTLRARPEDSTATPVFVFHPAGGSTVVYEPLLRRLPAHTPMYGFERVDGEIDERAAEYLEPLREIQPHGPYVLVGWSLGGVLAYAVAQLLRAAGEEVDLVGLIDVVMPGEQIPDTEDERRARWERYIAFAEKTYGVEVPLPVDELAKTDDEGAVEFLLGLLDGVDLPIPSGVIEHQRTSFLENRALARAAAQLTAYDGKTVLYMADSYHEGAIELEPAYATRAADGGWGEVLSDLDIVQVGGDHLQIVDEPYIATVGADLTARLAAIDAARG